jgi:DNA-binding transcriptional regulator YdaS (Cro superfamily)
MNSTTTRRATALVCAAVATLAMLAATDVLVTQMNSGAVLAAATPAMPAAQVVVITGQRAARS